MAMPSCLLQRVSPLPCRCPPKPALPLGSRMLTAAPAACRQLVLGSAAGSRGAEAGRAEAENSSPWSPWELAVAPYVGSAWLPTACSGSPRTQENATSPHCACPLAEPRGGVRPTTRHGGHREGPHQKWWQCPKLPVPICCCNSLHQGQALPATATAASATASASATALQLNCVTWILHLPQVLAVAEQPAVTAAPWWVLLHICRDVGARSRRQQLACARSQPALPALLLPCPCGKATMAAGPGGAAP